MAGIEVSKLDFGFALFEYSLVLVVIGTVITVILRSWEDGWPKAKTRWAYPLLFLCTGVLIVTNIIQFVRFVRAF